VIRTDGVPLFVEELTKMVLESGLLHERQGRYELTGPLPPLAIPATLRDSLTARLDRLASAKEVAQLGATLGREFNYELLQLVSTLDDATLQNELTHLVEAELLYRSGLPPRAKYIFKHVLIQEAAYRSQLRSKRQQVHLQVAQVLEDQMPETAETQPELIAHHYSAAGLAEHAVPYWLMAGKQALQRSANVEAISHLNHGLASLESLPDTPERVQQELTLQIALGNALIAIQGYAAPEVRQTYARARELCRQMAGTPQLLPVLYGLWANYLVAAEHRTAYELGQEFLDEAQGQEDPSVIVAHRAMGLSSLFLGEFTLARTHFESIATLYNPELHQSLAFQYGQDAGASGLSVGSWSVWLLGYPEQSLDWARKAASLARSMSHPLSLAFALTMGAIQFQYRREVVTAREYVDEAITLSDEHGFATWRTWGMLLRGWILAEQGQVSEGVTQIHESLSASRAQGTGLLHPYFLTLLAGMYGMLGMITEGLGALAEALALVEQSGENYWEAEIYRIKGELLRKASDDSMTKGEVGEMKADLNTSPEACFLKAIEISRVQKARSLELRAAVSLCRLWESQGKSNEGRQVLEETYGWFTEGFDTLDLSEAKALLDSLSTNQDRLRQKGRHE
jgi:predicted ATPase